VVVVVVVVVVVGVVVVVVVVVVVSSIVTWLKAWYDPLSSQEQTLEKYKGLLDGSIVKNKELEAIITELQSKVSVMA